MRGSLSPLEFHQPLCTAGRWLTSGDDHDHDGHDDAGIDDDDDDVDHDDDDIDDHDGDDDDEYDLGEFSSVSSFGKCGPHFTELLTDKSYHSSISSFSR